MRLMELWRNSLHSSVRLPALQRLNWQKDHRGCPFGRVYLRRARVAQRKRRSKRSRLQPLENKPWWAYIGPWRSQPRLDLVKFKHRQSVSWGGDTHPQKPPSLQSKPTFIITPSSWLVLCSVCAVMCTLANLLMILWTVGLAAADFYFV